MFEIIYELKQKNTINIGTLIIILMNNYYKMYIENVKNFY